MLFKLSVISTFRHQQMIERKRKFLHFPVPIANHHEHRNVFPASSTSSSWISDSVANSASSITIDIMISSPCLSLFLILYYTVFHTSTACVMRRSISIRAALHSFGNFRPASNTLVSRSPPTGSIVFTIPSGKTKCVACS